MIIKNEGDDHKSFTEIGFDTIVNEKNERYIKFFAKNYWSDEIVLCVTAKYAKKYLSELQRAIAFCEVNPKKSFALPKEEEKETATENEEKSEDKPSEETVEEAEKQDASPELTERDATTTARSHVEESPKKGLFQKLFS